MSAQDRAGAARASAAAVANRRALAGQHAPAAPVQPSFFEDHSAERERIAAEIAGRFAAYGVGTPLNSRNATAVTLAEQPAQFAFGVPVRAVVDAVLDLAGALPLPAGEGG